MTKARMAKLDRDSREKIAARDRESKEQIAEADRKSREKVEHAKAVKDVGIQRMKDRTTIGSSLIGGIAKVANPLELYISKDTIYDNAVAKIPVDFKYSYKTAGDVVGFDANQGYGSIPQIFAMRYADTLGFLAGSAASSPINVGATNQMTKLRENNSRMEGYDPSDIVQVELATCSLYSGLRFAKRVLSYTTVTNPTNMNFKANLIAAAGFDPYDIIDNAKSHRQKLNDIIRDFNINCKLPKALALAVRKDILASYTIVDSSEDNCHLIVPAPEFIYVYEEEDATLNAETYDSFDALLNLLRRACQALKESPTLITMYADMNEAVQGNIYQIEFADSKDTPIFVMSTDIGDQIRNADVLPWYGFIDLTDHTTAGNNLTQVRNMFAQMFSIEQDEDGWLKPANAEFTNDDGNSYYVGSIALGNLGVTEEQARTIWAACTGHISLEKTFLNVTHETVNQAYLVEPLVFKYLHAYQEITSLAEQGSVVEYKLSPTSTEVITAFYPIDPILPNRDEFPYRYYDKKIIPNLERLGFWQGIRSNLYRAFDKLASMALAVQSGWHPITYLWTSDINLAPVCFMDCIYNVPKANVARIAQMGSISLLNIVDFNTTFSSAESHSGKRSKSKR